MNCPRCKKTLSPVMIGKVELDVCRSCQGLWFDRGELGKVLEEEGAIRGTAADAAWKGKPPEGETPGARELSCPRCGGLLARYGYGGSKILVDGCDKRCGVWVDDGEFREIYGIWLDSLGAPNAPGRRKAEELLAGAKAAQREKEELFIDNLTTLDDQPGVTGTIGKLIQWIYTGFYKAGLR